MFAYAIDIAVFKLALLTQSSNFAFHSWTNGHSSVFCSGFIIDIPTYKINFLFWLKTHGSCLGREPVEINSYEIQLQYFQAFFFFIFFFFHH